MSTNIGMVETGQGGGQGHAVDGGRVKTTKNPLVDQQPTECMGRGAGGEVAEDEGATMLGKPGHSSLPLDLLSICAVHGLERPWVMWFTGGVAIVQLVVTVLVTNSIFDDDTHYSDQLGYNRWFSALSHFLVVAAFMAAEVLSNLRSFTWAKRNWTEAAGVKPAQVTYMTLLSNTRDVTLAIVAYQACLILLYTWTRDMLGRMAGFIFVLTLNTTLGHTLVQLDSTLSVQHVAAVPFESNGVRRIAFGMLIIFLPMAYTISWLVGYILFAVYMLVVFLVCGCIPTPCLN